MDTDPHGESPLLVPSAIVTATPEPGCGITIYWQNTASADDVILYSSDVRVAFITTPHELTVFKNKNFYLHDLLNDQYYRFLDIYFQNLWAWASSLREFLVSDSENT